MNIVLELINLKKYYDDTRGIESVNITLNEGEVYGFIGPNGAGKSTTIRTLMGLLNRTAGTILINGKELDNNDLETKKIIGYLPSEINLYKELKVKDMLNYHELFFENINNRRKELVNLFQLDENKKVGDLSLGNLKKLGIILAMMHSPKILILDEPTSGLDPIMQNIFYELLKEEKRKGTTILYSTHVLSEVSKICDRIGIIKDGVIIKEDTVEGILSNSATYLTIESKEITKIKEVIDLKILCEEGNKIKFWNTLKPNDLIKKLNKIKIDRLLIEEVPIENLFLDYYK